MTVMEHILALLTGSAQTTIIMSEIS